MMKGVHNSLCEFATDRFAWALVDLDLCPNYLEDKITSATFLGPWAKDVTDTQLVIRRLCHTLHHLDLA